MEFSLSQHHWRSRASTRWGNKVKCPRIFISPEELLGDTVSFSGNDARYLYKVLRLRPGDNVEICDGTRDYLIRLTSCNRGAVQGTVIESGSPVKPEGIEITLGFSTVRPGPVQEILRHGTELGVSRFVPILSLAPIVGLRKRNSGGKLSWLRHWLSRDAASYRKLRFP